jgi:hypothetical protein
MLDSKTTHMAFISALSYLIKKKLKNKKSFNLLYGIKCTKKR